MASFNPSKPIDDPTVWYPKGMYVKKEATEVAPSREVFILAQSDMASLNRYVWTAKLLPTTRDEYKQSLAITDGGVITREVWSAADNVLTTYGTMKTDASGFLGMTWPSIVELSSDIYHYATTAGGKSPSSYYANMLLWVGKYNEEKDKTEPNQKELKKYRDSILAITNMEIKKVHELSEKIDKAKEDLTTFHDKCKTSQNELSNHVTTMKSLLEGENGEIKKWNDQIAQIQKDIQSVQEEIDHDRLIVKTTAAYVWLPLGGTIAAVTVAVLYNKEIGILEESLKELKDIINQDQAKLNAALKLQTNINAMSGQLDKLVRIIKPAIQTLEKLQGAWGAIASDVKNLHDLFNDQTKEIPPMLLEETELENIVDQWNTLAKYADEYRQVAYLTNEPEHTTLDEYLDELDKAKKLK